MRGRWRRLLGASGWALGLLLLFGPVARAGSDVFGNVAPASQVPDGLAERYPLGNYALDEHFDAVEASLTGGVDVSGVPPMIAHFLANSLWQLTAFLADALITLFTFAFSLDLVTGSEATGGAGALEPVGQAIRALYTDVLGEPWLVVAIVILGMWAMWRALVQRRYTETVGRLGLSLLYLVLALAFVTQPERTIGEATRWTNDMSVAFLTLSQEGTLSSEDDAKRAASDQLFELLVYEPWTVLQFGGREHCVEGDGTDDEPTSVAVRPLSRDPDRDAALAAQLEREDQVAADGKTCISNRNKYAARFLEHAPGSEERKAEYEAINDGDTGELPDEQQDEGYSLDGADKPAADAMEEGGQYQRLLIAIVVFAGELGAFLLLGALAIGVILAQVLLLLLLAFAPVALILGVIPGRGHDFFRAWLLRIAGFLLRKAAYSLILAVVLAVNGALASASANLGWLLSFGLQGLFFWSVFLYRHQLADRLLAATAGPGSSRQEGTGRLASVYYGSQLATRPLRSLRRRTSPGGSGRGPATAATSSGVMPPAAVAPQASEADATNERSAAPARQDTRAASERSESGQAPAPPPGRGESPPAQEGERRSAPEAPGRAPRSSKRGSGEAGAGKQASPPPERPDRPPSPERADRGGQSVERSPGQRGSESALSADLRQERERTAPAPTEPGADDRGKPTREDR
ncbi:hypothetical protein HJD18_16365 [Thermoleophilia bacterium SCSIO 60948]|nr:hypothetical protein HJD18_16365 [Thermoleophilia bacterium SCSIO 60948]